MSVSLLNVCGLLCAAMAIILNLTSCGSGGKANAPSNVPVPMALSGSSAGGSSSSTASSSSGMLNNQGFDLKIPYFFPAPKIPTNNALSYAKVALGRHLFFDRQLSINEARSCADCHQPARAFSDGLATAIGITQEQRHARNAMGLVNLIYNAGFNWANPNMLTLEQQARAVLFNEQPVELGWTDKENELLQRLKADPRYPPLFSAAFGDGVVITVDNIILALASFERSLISAGSSYDRFIQGDTNALSAAAKRGLNLFFSEQMECFHCHGGFNFSQTVDHQGLSFGQLEFFNNGLYNRQGTGAYPADNTGLWEFTQFAEDMGKFRPPSLRNIALTAPYMHDGSLASLGDVLNHYARGGREVVEGSNMGDGAKNPYKSSLITGFNLTAAEREDVLAFFDSLTDWEFICAPEHNDPFSRLPVHSRCGSQF